MKIPDDKLILQCFEEGFTQSEIMTRMNCNRKWLYSYVLGLKRRGAFAWYNEVGGLIHEMLARYYMNADSNPEVIPEVPPFQFDDDVMLTPEQYREAKHWQTLCGILVYRHNMFYGKKDEFRNPLFAENIIEYEYNGIKLKGMIDLAGENRTGIWIDDHKTSGMHLGEVMFEGWQFRFQFLYYAWLFSKVYGKRPTNFFVNVIKKPMLRQSKIESDTNFLNRIDLDIQKDPEKYFQRHKLPMDDAMLDRFEEFILNPIVDQLSAIEYTTRNQIGILQRSQLMIANTDHCVSPFGHICPYIDLCKNDFKDLAGDFIVRKHKHPELNRSINED